MRPIQNINIHCLKVTMRHDLENQHKKQLVRYWVLDTSEENFRNTNRITNVLSLYVLNYLAIKKRKREDKIIKKEAHLAARLLTQ